MVNKGNKLVFNSNKIHVEIKYDDILYFKQEDDDKCIKIYTSNNVNISIKIRLDKLFKYLSEDFKQVHRYCIVNTKRVVEYDWLCCYFILDTGEKVDLLSKKFFVEKL